MSDATLSPRSARNVLIVLTFINLFNYIDRFVVAGVAEQLKHSELQLTDQQLGLLATAFLAVYALTSPWFGTLGDRRRRPQLIAFGVALWSLATVLGGFAVGFVTLFVARAFVGVGEAAYGTIAPSILADCFPKARRGRVFAVFYAAIPIGAALGLILAGIMLKAFDSWRAAFFVAGAPGLVLAAFLLRVPDPPRGAQDGVKEGAAAAPTMPVIGAWSSFVILARNQCYVFTVLGYAAYTFALGGIAWWMVVFLERVRGVPAGDAQLQAGGIVVVTGLLGTFLGGWVGDYVLKYRKNAYLLVSGIATIMAAPCAFLALTATKPGWYLAGLVAAELLLFVSTGPINSAIVNYVAPHQRATAMALCILVIHVLGDVPSPYLVGLISDARQAAGATAAAGLQSAVLILPAAILVGGIIWTVGALRHAPDDTPHHA